MVKIPASEIMTIKMSLRILVNRFTKRIIVFGLNIHSTFN